MYFTVSVSCHVNDVLTVHQLTMLLFICCTSCCWHLDCRC